jgi:hypothetical protein
MNAHSEFTVRLIPQSNTIQICGELTGEGLSLVAEKELQGLEAYPRGSKWTVEAQHTSILRGGAHRWLEIVDRYLREYDLVYPPSQLALILLCDEEYKKRYPRTVFLEEELITPT